MFVKKFHMPCCFSSCYVERDTNKLATLRPRNRFQRGYIQLSSVRNYFVRDVLLCVARLARSQAVPHSQSRTKREQQELVGGINTGRL